MDAKKINFISARSGVDIQIETIKVVVGLGR